jgi:hypothetical protein
LAIKREQRSRTAVAWRKIGRAQRDVVKIDGGCRINTKERQRVALTLLEHSDAPLELLPLLLTVLLLLLVLVFHDGELLDEFLNVLLVLLLDVCLFLLLDLDLVLKPANLFMLVLDILGLLMHLEVDIVDLLLEPLVRSFELGALVLVLEQISFYLVM